MFNKTPKTPGSNKKKQQQTPAKAQKSLLSFFTPKPTSSTDITAATGSPTVPDSPTRITGTSSSTLDAFQSAPPPSPSPLVALRQSRLNSAEAPNNGDESNSSIGPRAKRQRADTSAVEKSQDSLRLDPDDFVVYDENDDENGDEEPGDKRKRGKGKGKTVTLQTPFRTPAKKAPSSVSRFTFSPGPSSPAATPASARQRPKPTPAAENPPETPSKATKKLGEPAFGWLVDIHDADMHAPSHPDYDPRTIHIPPAAWKAFSPFERQYWEIKQRLFDTIVFFRKGKFYEIFEGDAVIGHRELGLSLTTRISMTMVGMPCSSFDMWAAQFLAKGYKVARVEEKETAIGRDMRGGSGKGDKGIIRRELESVLTGGTLVEGAMLQDEGATYCVAIKESETDTGVPTFGISFVDTATGYFFLTEFEDDTDRSVFETFVAQIRPRDLVVEKGRISKRAIRVLKDHTSVTTIWNKLKHGSEFWDAQTAITELNVEKYFDEEGNKNWPEALQKVKSKDNVMSSFGALLSYLQSLKIDRELVSLRNFSLYDPIKSATSLVMDGKTLLNLEIFANSYNGSSEGTLFAFLNRCTTPFGRRMLKHWVSHPLIDPTQINARLDAVEMLNADDTFTDTLISSLRKLPDLERLISRVHAGTSKAADFLRVLEGFETIRDAVEEVKLYLPGENGLIKQLLSKLPDLEALLLPWNTAFDREKAKESGVLVPEQGVEADFDESQSRVEGIMAELQELLEEYKSALHSRDLKYVDIGLSHYLVEVPVILSKRIPKSWDQVSSTQKVRRYNTAASRTLVRRLDEAKESHSHLAAAVASRFYCRFSADYKHWLSTCNVVANMDCLLSLAKVAAHMGEPQCRPVFVEGEGERTVLEFEELRHPCMAGTDGSFIPNDIQLGGERPKLTLLTGANAAGKSTILRMTATAVLLTHLGLPSPSLTARLTPITSILSRLGASDNILCGQSTFFVELSETQRILSSAGPRSLVILDELGRGTSSYDGVAVAGAVLHHLATHKGCVGFFATHYHALAQEFGGHPEVGCGRMRIEVDEEVVVVAEGGKGVGEGEGEGEGEVGGGVNGVVKKTVKGVRFAYKLEPGLAGGSFAMHCAAMCGVAPRIIERAEQAARRFEKDEESRLGERAVVAVSGGSGKGGVEEGEDKGLRLGLLSDVAAMLWGEQVMEESAMDVVVRGLEML